MPQLNRKYPNEAAKIKKREERIKTDEYYKGILNRLVVVAGWYWCSYKGECNFKHPSC